MVPLYPLFLNKISFVTGFSSFWVSVLIISVNFSFSISKLLFCLLKDSIAFS
jgi:hypothetical protein